LLAFLQYFSFGFKSADRDCRSSSQSFCRSVSRPPSATSLCDMLHDRPLRPTSRTFLCDLPLQPRTPTSLCDLSRRPLSVTQLRNLPMRPSSATSFCDLPPLLSGRWLQGPCFGDLLSLFACCGLARPLQHTMHIHLSPVRMSRTLSSERPLVCRWSKAAVLNLDILVKAHIHRFMYALAHLTPISG
jgi:hypothetical protein